MCDHVSERFDSSLTSACSSENRFLVVMRFMNGQLALPITLYAGAMNVLAYGVFYYDKQQVTTRATRGEAS
jgi:hypothetical protein